MPLKRYSTCIHVLCWFILDYQSLLMNVVSDGIKSKIKLCSKGTNGRRPCCCCENSEGLARSPGTKSEACSNTWLVTTVLIMAVSCLSLSLTNIMRQQYVLEFLTKLLQLSLHSNSLLCKISYPLLPFKCSSEINRFCLTPCIKCPIKMSYQFTSV